MTNGMRWMFWAALLWSFGAGAQQPETGKATPLTIRTGAKLVVVDVVVTDREHHRVQGLKQEDFTVTEGSERQTIRSFEEHTPGEVVMEAAPKVLAAGTFTNEEPRPRSAAVNVILIDVLNTPMKDQPYLRAQMAKYLREMKPGISLAVFALNAKPVMLQGFSSDPKVLQAALEGTMPSRSVLLTDEAEQGSTAETVTARMQEAGLEALLGADKMARMQSQEDQAKSEQVQVRSKVTLDGLDSLARYLAGIPGRKNLIWFSGAFPVDIMPRTPSKYRGNPNYDAFAQLGSSEREFRETTNLMARSQVAVYPVDSRGLMVSSAMNVQSSGAGMAANPRLFGENEDNFFQDTADEHSTMERIAYETGGRAFLNSNNFSGAIDAAVEDGTTYYTLAYTPTDAHWRGDLRTIAVHLTHGRYVLTYRHGYYADDPESATSALVGRGDDSAGELHGRLDQSELLRVMGHGLPAATQVLYKVSILPSAYAAETELTNGNVSGGSGYAPAHGPFRRYVVGFHVDPKTVELRKGEDGVYHGMLVFAAWVFQSDGRPVTTRLRQMQVAANGTQLEHLTTQTIDFEMEMSVPVKGDYSIRTGVLDASTRSVGAVEVAVAMVKDLPPAPVKAERAKPVLKAHPQ